jgi:mannose-6-phosphate isomerase-like protein (cupin superfamily)
VTGADAERGKVNLAAALASLPGPWQPRVVAAVDDYDVKVARLQGESATHASEAEDELFLVVAGLLRIELHDRAVELGPGELMAVRGGEEHKLVALPEAEVVIFERRHAAQAGNRS